jgi:SAM-dependent methyltransferase
MWAPGRLVKDQLSYRRCDSCDAFFTETPGNPNLETALEEYETAYLQYLARDAADDRNHAELLTSLRRWGIPLVGPILDVGCGSGKFVRYLRDQGLDAHGVEPADALFDAFLDEPYFHRDLEAAIRAAGGRFAVVFALDVVEHVAEPLEFLRALRAGAVPNGYVVLSTPDAGSRVAKALGHRWHHVNRYHLSLLSRRALLRAAARVGLQAQGIEHPGRYRSAGYVARYLFEFGLRRPAPGFIGALDDRLFPVNLRDTMLVALATG